MATVSMNNKEINMEEITKKVIAGETTYQIELGLTDEELEAMYMVGFNFYNQERYEDAKKTFALISVLKPTEYKYAFALASAHRMNGDFENAILGYFAAAGLSPTNPTPFVHMAECLIHLDDLIGAKENLERAIEIAGDNEDYQDLKNRAQIMLQNLKKKLQN